MSFNVWDRATLTELIMRPISTQFEDQPQLGSLIAPVKNIQETRVKLNKYGVNAFGVGQFKAKDAAPGLFQTESSYEEQLIELVDLDEMHRVTADEMRQLQSKDPVVRKIAGANIVQRGEILGLRNERLTEKMRWDVFSGSLDITYPTGSSYTLDYNFTADQTPTAGTLWSNTSSADPIANLKAWSNSIASATGYYGKKIHMSSDTFEYIVRNENVRNLLTATNRAMLIPTKDDILSLLRDGSEIIIYDNGYLPESAGTSVGVPDDLTRFLPRGKVLITTDYKIQGVDIANTYNGPVAIKSSADSFQHELGPSAEVMVDMLSKTTYFRVASSRMTVLNFPKCFVYATVL